MGAQFRVRCGASHHVVHRLDTTSAHSHIITAQLAFAGFLVAASNSERQAQYLRLADAESCDLQSGSVRSADHNQELAGRRSVFQGSERSLVDAHPHGIGH